MQKWLRISLLLCTFGFLRELRPSEPFVAEFYSGPWRNITIEEVNKEVYPIGIYSTLALLVIIFLITDILRYKPIIVLSACVGIIMYAIFLWTSSMFSLKISQLFWGFYISSEVAYYTYIYAKVDRSRYQIVTGHTRSAILSGKFLGALLGQVLVSTNSMDYRQLNIISFGSQIASLFVALSLPAASKSLYFYTNGASETTETATKTDLEIVTNPSAIPQDEETKSDTKLSWRNAFRLLLQHIVAAYTNKTVVQWSIWWILTTGGQLQVISFAQFLWKEIDPEHENLYNGAVEATVTLLGAGGAMAAGFINSNRHKAWHMWILTLCSLFMGVFVIVSGLTDEIWVAYIMYILFGLFYFFMITIASGIVAKNLSDDSFGLIFGINTMLALVLNTIITLVVVTDKGYGLTPRHQYIVYGSYFLSLSVIYGLYILLRYIIRRFCRQDLNEL